MAQRSLPACSILLRSFASLLITAVLQIPALFGQSSASNAHPLSGHVPAALAASRLVARVPREARIKLAIGLPLRNQAALDALVAAVSDPRSPAYQHFLTPDEFSASFAPAEEDYAAAIAFAQAHHLEIAATHSNRGVLMVTGTAPDIEEAFGVTLNLYQHPTRGQFYSPDREPTAPAGLAIQDISGLDNFSQPHPMNLSQTAATSVKAMVSGSGPGGYFIGKDFRTAYAPAVTLNGTGQSVGLIEFDGFFPADAAANFAAAGQAPVTTQTVLLDGMTGAAGGDNIEVILDIMMASYMAPGLSKVIVYEGQVPNDILNRMATDNLAQQLSSSWGFPINATTEQIFKQFIAQGQSMLQASGDSGGYTKGIMPPSDDPSVTVVGGTSLTTAGAGGVWQAETTWSGSGGGVSTVYPIPSWQVGQNIGSKGGSNTMRNTPDVALTADIQMFLVCNNGQRVSVGGTSAAAPLWAGFIALANQQASANAKPRVGFLNPQLYAIGASGNYGTDLHDITQGSNGAFKALAGYDLTTGWGSPVGQHLIYDLTGTSATGGFTITSSATALTVSRPNSAATTISVLDVGGFKGTVALTTSALPTGVTAAFASASTTTSSSLGFTVAASTATGVYPITVTGTSGTLKETVVVTLTVVAPSFTLAAASPALTINRPGTASTAIVVSESNGLTGNVALVVSGLPAGVTSSFSSSATATQSVLTLTAGSSAAAGTTAVTITGTNGSLKATTTVSLTVAVPSFTISFAPASLGVPRGSSASGVASILPANGFTGTIVLSAAGLPAGVSMTAGKATATAIPVTFGATSTAIAGTYGVTLTATSGTITSTAKVSVTVIAAQTGTSFVNLAANYNVFGIAVDTVGFAGTGMDGGLNGLSEAYSGTLLGLQQTIAGSTYFFGPANALDAVSSQTIPLPAGQYSALKFLATGVNGGQANQVFKVTYTDGTSTSTVQSLSDWFTPASYVGEAKAVTMTYRDTGTGLLDRRTFYLYGYSITLNPAKTVASVTLPNNRNVVLLAATLTGATSATTH